MWWRVGRRRTSLGAAWRQLRKISSEASRCGGGDWAGGGLQDIGSAAGEGRRVQGGPKLPRVERYY